MNNQPEIIDILREFYKVSGFRVSIHDTEFNEIYAYPQKISPIAPRYKAITPTKKRV